VSTAAPSFRPKDAVVACSKQIQTWAPPPDRDRSR
jgi:hypothetical protein